MNWIDKAVAAVSPQAGLRRMRARVALNAVAELGYDAAKAGRRTDGWMRPGSSANAEVADSLTKLRDSMRDLVRNNPLARKAIWELKAKAVGTGITPQARTGDIKLNKRVDELFAKWAPECNAEGRRVGFYSMQALAARTIFESGECLARFRPRRKSDGLTVPLQVQLLEPDFVDHTKTEELKSGYVIQGVEFNKLGKEVACWLYPTHPGDVVNTSWFRRGRNVSERIEAYPDNPLAGLERGYIMERAGQVRGVPWGVASIMPMHDLDGYADAERVRKRVEACLAAFITSAESGTDPAIGVQTTDSNGNTVESFEPGMIVRTRPGESVTFAEPKAVGGYPEYIRGEQRTIAAGWLIPYEILTGDLSQINYSSYRGGLLSFRDIVEDFRWNILIPFFCDPVWRKFIQAAILAGLLPEDTPYDVEWAPPPFNLLDREAEALADIFELRIGKKSWPQLVGEQGLDAQKHLETIAEWNKKFDDLGVVLDCDPRKTARAGVAQKSNEDKKNLPQDGAQDKKGDPSQRKKSLARWDSLVDSDEPAGEEPEDSSRKLIFSAPPVNVNVAAAPAPNVEVHNPPIEFHAAPAPNVTVNAPPVTFIARMGTQGRQIRAIRRDPENNNRMTGFETVDADGFVEQHELNRGSDGRVTHVETITQEETE
jgi:lambda family phage portal protein